MWISAWLLALASPAASGSTFEDTVRAARESGPTARMGREDLTIAKHRLGQSVARLLPQISASDRYSYRYNNPERYTYSVESGEDCDEEASSFCLPVAFGGDGQISLPENRFANTLTLNGVLPISSTAITGVQQQRLAGELTRVQVRGQDEGLVLDLVRDYAELQYALGALAMYEESLALALETLRVVDGQAQVGEATALDLDLAKLDADQRALMIAQLERWMPTAVAHLALSSGQSLDDGVQVCPFLEDLDTGQPLSVESATRLASVETELRMDRLRRTNAQLAVLPTLTLTGAVSYTGNGETNAEMIESFLFDNWSVGANLSFDVFDGFGRHHALRESAASVRRTEIDLANERARMELDDAQLALSLAEVAENLDLAEREVALQEREVEATRSRYLDSGDVPFDRYTQARSVLEQRELQRLSLQRQQAQLTAQRWISAGHVEELLAQLFAHEHSAATASACRTFRVGREGSTANAPSSTQRIP